MIPNLSLSTATAVQLSLETCNSLTPVKLGDHLYEATKNRDIESVRIIFNSQNFESVSNSAIATSLQHASLRGYVEITEQLIQSKKCEKIFHEILSFRLNESLNYGQLDLAYKLLQGDYSQNIPLETLQNCLLKAIREDKIEFAQIIIQSTGSTERLSSISASLQECVARMDRVKLVNTLQNAVKINFPELTSAILKNDNLTQIPYLKLFEILKTAIMNHQSAFIEVLITNDKFKQLLLNDEILEATLNTSQWKLTKIILLSMEHIGINQIKSIFLQILKATSNTDSLEIAKIMLMSDEFKKISSYELANYLKTAVNNHDSTLVELFLDNDRFKSCELDVFIVCLRISLHNNDWKIINTLLPLIIQLDVMDLKLLLSSAMAINTDLSIQTLNTLLDSHIFEEISNTWLCSFFERNIISNNWEFVKAIFTKKLSKLSIKNLEMCLKRAADNEKEDIVLMILTSHRYKDIPSECLTMIFERFATLGYSKIVDAILRSTRFNEIPTDLITSWFNP